MREFNLLYEIDGSRRFNTQIGRLEVNPGDPDDYEESVANVFQTISNNKIVGQKILNANLFTSVRVMPWTGAADARTVPINVAGSMKPGQSVPDPKHPNHPIQGTGKGTDSVIFFNPEVSHEVSGPAMKLDQILAHEIVHSIRMGAGLVERKQMGGNWGEFEEFVAVVIANVYCSETQPGSSLRDGVRGQFCGSLGCYSNISLEARDLNRFTVLYAKELNQIYDEMDALCYWLSLSQATFNPFRIIKTQRDNANPWNKPIDMAAVNKVFGVGL
jgi:hypothetical protein